MRFSSATYALPRLYSCRPIPQTTVTGPLVLHSFGLYLDAKLRLIAGCLQQITRNIYANISKIHHKFKFSMSFMSAAGLLGPNLVLFQFKTPEGISARKTTGNDLKIHFRVFSSLPIYSQHLLVLLFGTFRVIHSNCEAAQGRDSVVLQNICNSRFFISLAHTPLV